MIKVENKANCCGCHACFNICHTSAIEMKEDDNGFKYPKVNVEKCTNCNLCKKVCPILNNKNIENNPKAYAMYNLDEQVRKTSSSGGIFTLIAEIILKRKGIVFGAKFNDDFEVEHDYIDNINDIYKFRGSKYVQSNIGNCYQKVRKFLENNKYVLFSGTPCQIEGLKTFLGKEYEKLYTQDIICHGVPSPRVWRKYLKYMNKDKKGKLMEINFRQKDNGWKDYQLYMKYHNKKYIKKHQKDLYMRAFLGNLCLRESCYKCHFKKQHRVSDVTLADFWGINNIFPSINDNKGISLVIINSKKGQELYEKIKNNVEYKEVNLEEAIKYNKSMISSVNEPMNKKIFLKEVTDLNFKKVVNRYTEKRGMLRKIENKIRNIRR